MKKGGVASIILRSFLRTMGVILIFLAVGVASFYLTRLYYQKTARTERSTAYTHVIDVNTGSESSNLIYSFDKETGNIKAMVLELFDESTKNLVTIPKKTQISISTNTYEELVKASQNVPQLASMKKINQYFSGDVAYEYGIIILQEELKADIGYFTAIPSDKFDEYFENAGSKKKPKYKPSSALLDKVDACESQKDMEKLMDKEWEHVISDITLSQKKHYAEAFTQINRDYIRTFHAYTYKSGKSVRLSIKKNKRLINNIWESDTYTSAQKDKTSADKTVDAAALGYSIQVTNGSGINGLASAYQKKLEADGWTVQGIGNYAGGIQTTTTIYAQDKSWAKGLQSYFKDADIVQADQLTNGAEIEIVLGTNDALQ